MRWLGRCSSGIVSSSGVAGASDIASLVTFACTSLGVRILARGIVVIVSTRIISGVRIAICGHGGLKNFKNKRRCDNLAKEKNNNLKLLLEVESRISARESNLHRLHRPSSHAARLQRGRARDSLRSRLS